MKNKSTTSNCTLILTSDRRVPNTKRVHVCVISWLQITNVKLIVLSCRITMGCVNETHLNLKEHEDYSLLWYVDKVDNFSVVYSLHHEV
jgi:hypothetical protein